MAEPTPLEYCTSLLDKMRPLHRDGVLRAIGSHFIVAEKSGAPITLSGDSARVVFCCLSCVENIFNAEDVPRG